ncbi:MAG TPA: PEP-CTERM sorting domain-containing protein [Phycisphaerales bacterium]|nr:PEP-CTERM sorting domain-containing protein [Phycisphaerales bacterium]
MPMRSRSCLFFAAAAVSTQGVSAALITDPAGDLINGFNAATSPDLDVLQAEVAFDMNTSTFTFTSTSAGAIGTTAAASFVWGVNRGAGTAGFAANGLPNILFDRIVRLVPGGQSQIIGGGLPAINIDPSAVTISGSTITATIAAGLLPGNGFTPENYTVNLWPRTDAPSGFAGIADFAPDTANAPVTVVPAPAAVLLLGLGGLGAARRRRPSGH